MKFVPWQVATGLGILAGSCGVALLWLRRRLFIVTVKGRSMEPTYRSGQQLLVRRVRVHNIRAGQVVVVAMTAPEVTVPFDGWKAGTGTLIIKRATAVPGDPVPAGLAPILRTAPGMPVPPGRLVVLGDNPDATVDSRTFGYVPADRVRGVVIRCLGD